MNKNYKFINSFYSRLMTVPVNFILSINPISEDFRPNWLLRRSDKKLEWQLIVLVTGGSKLLNVKQAVSN